MGVLPPGLTLRARLSFAAHVFKALTQQHHRNLIPVLRPLVPRDGVILDVGGHAGQFAKLFSRLAPAGRVYTFEPGGYARAILLLTVGRRGNVEIVPVGVGESPGNLSLSVPIKASGSVGFGLSHFGEAERSHMTEQVPVITLDFFVADKGLERVDFLKADIEGWERRMLAGATALFQRFRPAALLEVTKAALTRAGDTPAAIFAFFDAMGYQSWSLDSRRPKPVDAPCEGDILWIPAEQVAKIGVW